MTCSEQEGIGAPDEEALFSMSLSYISAHEIYISDSIKYISDFPIYRLTDKSRQYQRLSPLLLSIYYNPFYVKI
ncbi:hypothetical protein CN307_23370 [Bacillus cereus]|uniref:Uncharacterized protein n=1 Tax=Bacillus cereus TaxID=1396 RepID=A0A2A8ZUT9_BACCE|nr:hypothetical protein CN307_23370 [Bacillus cereus]